MIVFLIGDIGSGSSESFHIGDEAMHYHNTVLYKKLFSATIYASSRNSKTDNPNIDKILPDVHIKDLLHFVKLFLYILIFRYLRISLFNKEFKKTIASIIKSDLLHISGGGNINSIWPGHIYYRVYMIFVAKIYGIPIILTSQTIGPITKFTHRFLLKNFLNMVKYIGIRDNDFSRSCLDSLGIKKPIIRFSLDDAFDLSLLESLKLKRMIKAFSSQKYIRVGISLHEWNNGKINHKWLIKNFLELHKKYSNIRFYIIPHVFDKLDGNDIAFMKNILSEIGSKFYYVFSFRKLMRLTSNKTYLLPSVIKTITSEMDVIISTRYHGLVFATSLHKKAIAINYDEYYSAKNKGILKLFSDNSSTINDSREKLLTKLETAMKNDNVINKNNFIFEKKEELKIISKILK